MRVSGNPRSSRLRLSQRNDLANVSPLAAGLPQPDGSGCLGARADRPARRQSRDAPRRQSLCPFPDQRGVAVWHEPRCGVDADQRPRRRLLTAYFAPARKHTGCSRDRPNPSVRLPGSARLLLSSRPLGPRHRNGDGAHLSVDLRRLVGLLAFAQAQRSLGRTAPAARRSHSSRAIFLTRREPVMPHRRPERTSRVGAVGPADRVRPPVRSRGRDPRVRADRWEAARSIGTGFGGQRNTAPLWSVP